MEPKVLNQPVSSGLKSKMETAVAEIEASQDLNVMAAAANGRSVTVRSYLAKEVLRAAKVEQLKAQYQAGQYLVDEKALASKIIDTLLQK